MYKLILALIIVVIVFGCNYDQPSENVAKFRLERKKAIALAKTVFVLIKADEADSIRLMLSEKFLTKTNKEELITLISDCKELLDNSSFPADGSIVSRYDAKCSSAYNGHCVELSFPFHSGNSENPITYIRMIVVGSLIYGIELNDNAPESYFPEPKQRTPHLDGVCLKYDDITWFRIWYGAGVNANDYGDSYGYYAVSGRKRKLDRIEIQGVLTNIFSLLCEAKIDSTDYKQNDDGRNGTPEHIHLRFKFDNLPYNKFGEISLECILNEEPGEDEELGDYITVKHSKNTRYLYRKNNNPDLVRMLKLLAYRDYGAKQEFRWH